MKYMTKKMPKKKLIKGKKEVKKENKKKLVFGTRYNKTTFNIGLYTVGI